MNSNEIRYFRDLIGYYGVMITAVVIICTGYIVTPEAEWLGLGLVLTGSIMGSYSWGLFKDGWIRKVWSFVREYNHEPLLDREEVLLEGGEL